MVVATVWRKGEMGGYCLMNTEFQFCKMKRDMEMDAGDGCITI